MGQDVVRWKKNFHCFQQILPKIAEKVEKANLSSLQIVATRKKERNITINGTPLHASYSAEMEAKRWFSPLCQEEETVLIVYGLGLGYAYDACKAWLAQDPNHYLVFIEDDLAVLHSFLHTERATHILKDRQVQLHFLEEGALAEPMISWVGWYFIQCKVEISALPSYEKNKRDRYTDLRRWISHDLVQKNAMVGEYLRHGASFFYNYYSNILQLPSCYSADALAGTFSQVPAIICGEGPSLDQAIPLLKNVGNRALVFAGGSSVNALTAQGVRPHFGGGIDPNPTQLQRLMTAQSYGIPYIVRARMHHEAFEAINGPRFLLSGSGGYCVSEFFEKKLGIIPENVDEGHNVINFLMEIARMMGCNPIILVGMDLAYTGLRSYAGGVVENSSVEKEQILASRDLDSNAFVRPDIHGNPVYTLWKWVTESSWVSRWSKLFPATEVINATGGGIGFEQIANRDFASVIQQRLGVETDIEGRVHAFMQEAIVSSATKEEMERLYKRLYQSTKECAFLAGQMVDEIAVMVKKEEYQPSKKAEKLEKQLLEEESFHYILGVFNDIFTKVQHRQHHQIKHDWRLTTQQEKSAASLFLNRDKFRFLQQVAETNCDVMKDVAEAYNKKNGEQSLILCRTENEHISF